MKACEGHCSYMSSACDGLGVDRLLLGLSNIAKDLGYQTLELFEDTGFQKSKNWELSTSQVSSNYFNVGFGPISEDSFGVCYSLRDKTIVANVSWYKKDNSDKFVNMLNDSLMQMKMLINRN